MGAFVGSGQGRGGNISIDPDFVILEHSQIVADAFGGPGGNITVAAQGFIADAASRVSASSALAAPGNVNIQALTNVSGVVAPLPQTFVQAGAVLRKRCAERRRGGKSSTLVLARRDGVPQAPGGMWPSPLTRAALPARTAGGEQPEPARVADAGGRRGDENGSSHQGRKPAQSLSPAVVALECARGREERRK
jgi:large exoprotein involved in heme utilization and adhesion